MAMSDQIYYRWKKQYKGLAIHEIRRLSRKLCHPRQSMGTAAERG
jgi:hypothetical protein